MRGNEVKCKRCDTWFSHIDYVPDPMDLPCATWETPEQTVEQQLEKHKKVCKGYEKTVKCYDCNEQVKVLFDHRKTCTSKQKTYSTQIKCYDCQQMVYNLREHRNECTRRRKK
jgi:hypothetical protein